MLFRKNKKISGISVIIPSLNSEKIISPLLSLITNYYEDVIVGIDSKTSDSTKKVVQKFDCRTITIKNDQNYVEGMFGSFFDSCKYDWILRIDDDELISNGLIQYTRNKIQNNLYNVIGIHRKWCRFKNNSLESFEGPPFEMDWQYRLFRKSKIRLKNKIHTPGFDFDDAILLNQRDAYIIHLDWIYHSYDERLKKVEKYERIKPTTRSRHYYLYEDILNSERYFSTLKDEELTSFIRDALNLEKKHELFK